MLQYRVIVVHADGDRFEAYVRAFPSLRVTGATPAQAVAAARVEIAEILAAYAREGQRPPAPDRQAVAIEMVSLPFETDAQYRPNVQIEITSGKVYKDGHEVHVRGGALALLVSLAMETRDASTGMLCERLYPTISGEQAYSALKMCVYRARKQLGARAVIETTEHGYRLAEHVVVDVRFLPQIVRAIRARSTAKAVEGRLDAIFDRLVEGRPAAYAGWAWFEPAERSLRTATREIGSYLANRALRADDAQRALEIARLLAALDPLDETAHELEIRAHLSRGDRASALRAFRRYADDLQNLHGMEPSPALRSLVAAAPP